MAKSKYSALGLPEYLFQEQSQTSPQISPDATFNPANALGGGGGFVSQTAPNQQPKKKEIYLDYKSIFRLWKSENVALVIAKLKKEGFEVAFIQKLENGKIFTSKIDDSKFKDKKGNSQNIFELSDDFIKDNFSQQDHKESIKKLNLASDDSIILDYAQFKEIHSLLTQEHWVDEEKVNVRSNLAWSFLEGSTKKSDKLYADVINSANDANILPSSSIEDLVNHEDFDIQDPATIKAFTSALNRLTGLNDPTNHGFFQYNFFGALDEKKLGDLFDATPSLEIEEGKKNLLKKDILEQLWFKHSNFEEGVIKRAQTLEEFKDKTPHEIGISLYGDLESFSYKVAENLTKNYSLDISKRYPVVRSKIYFKIFNLIREYHGSDLAFSILTKQQKENTTFGQKIKVNFALEDNAKDDYFIKYRLSGPEGAEEYEESLSLKSFIALFSDSEINQHFELTEKFGDALIANLKERTNWSTFSTIMDGRTTSFYTKIVEQLNEDQRKRFLDDLLEKASSLDIDNVLGEESGFMQVFSVVQNNLDKPKMKELAETMLIELTEKIKESSERYNAKPKDIFASYNVNLFFNNLTPEFQDFLIEMDKDGKIKINEIRFHAGEEIYAKFDKDPLRGLTLLSGMEVMPRDTYLKNYKKIIDSRNSYLSWDKSKVSSQKIPTSPLQINLFDLNDETLKKIKNEIDKGDLDAKNILSLNIFGIEREKTDKAREDDRILLDKLFALFPDLKHVRVDEGGVESSNLVALDLLNEKGRSVFLDIYNSSDPKNTTATNSPKADLTEEAEEIIGQEPEFTATKQGDTIYMGNANGSGAKNNGKENTFLMEEAGEIISRQQKTPLKVRGSSNKINPNFSGIEDNLFAEIDISSLIDLEACKKNKEEFEEQKNELSQTTSPDKTICSFTRNLEKNKKTTLPSISPDNEIIGYFTNPPKAKVTFFKDEKSGFYCAQSSETCQIHYIIQGRELESRTPTNNLDDLPDNVKKILNQYGVGDTSKPFPFSVSNDKYELPEFSNRGQFLNELFNIENKGACRHRVAALAHKFLQKGLKYDEDFRIIATDGNHVLLEVNKGDEWIALDMGGANFSALAHGFTKDDDRKTIPSASPSSPSIHELLIKNELAKRNQLTKIDTLTAFEKELKKSLKTKNSSLFLKTTRGEELKNYLLKMGSSLQDSGASVFNTRPSEKSFEAFYVSSPQDLTVKKLTLGISQDPSQDPSQDAQIAKITDTTPLFSFLEKAKENEDKKHVLIIDWGKFNASSQVAFNTMFDKNDRKIDDQKIPANVTIVCIDSSKQKTTDSSILSRFGNSYDLSSIGKNQYTNSLSANSSQDKKIIRIDGEGFINWQEKLFGRVVLNGDKMEWQKSDFVKNLEQPAEQPLQLNFKNFSSEQQKEMNIFFKESQAKDLVNYHGYEIKVPSDLIIHFEKKEFEFTEVLKSFKSPRIQDSQASSQSPLTLKIYQDLQASKGLSQDLHLINSFLFDKLLAQPKIEDNQYKENLGLIEQASKSDSKTLKLFLSENLSNQQFYCLLNQAKQHQVSLEFYLAKDVKMPDKGFDKFTQEESKQEIAIPAQTSDSGITISSPPPKKELQPTSRIIITNDIEKSLAQFKQKQAGKALNLVNIEDVLYGDLFEKNQHKLTQSEDGTQNFSFEKIESAIKTKLDAKEIVVLKGQFSDELLSILHPQILDMQKQFSNLHFIIEDKNISESKLESTKLSWLESSLYEVKHVAKTAEQTKNPRIAKEQFDCVGEEIPENSLQEAQGFIAKRKETLQDLLDNNSVLQIFGHSGVGKSSLFRELKKDGFAIYDELSSFESWANNKNQGKPKILVIDEFNVDGSTNFTTFRDLANNPNSPQQIFHQGKFYDLDKDHKVVFLGNPKSYGNRFEQKLFSDCEVAEWHLNDFPTSYIYENILNKPIFEGLSNAVKASLKEEDFKEIAIEKIKSYKKANRNAETKVHNELEDDDLPKETVRELQEKVLKEIVKKIPKTELGNVENANFIATKANQESIEQLQSAIQIRQLQKNGEFPPQFLGTCGVIFEGDSGVGKSVMIEAVLENRGITKVDSLEDLRKTLSQEKLSQQETEITLEKKPHFYYKIPASLPIEEIKKNLIIAFELGVIVVFDEMNTRIKESGLEKDVNALLTGQHPTDSTKNPEAGFMIIASVNQATQEGRSNFSSAIEHRCNIISANPLSEYQKEDFKEIIKNWIKNDKDLSSLKPDESTIKNTAESFQELLRKDPSAYNLRDLKKSLQNIWKDPNSQKITGRV